MSDFDTITYGEHSISATKLPAVSLHRLASYGLAHYLGNQAASKVVAWADKAENANATDEQKAAQKATFQSAMVQALMDGTIGQHAARGPAVDPVEAIQARLAKAEVLKVLKENGIKAPKKEEEVEFKDGTKLSMDALIERRIAKHGERLMTEAKKEVADKARKAKKLAENAGNDVSDLL